MEIPTYGAPKVQSTEAPAAYGHVNPADGEALVRGLEHVDQSLGEVQRAGEAYARARRAAEQKANQVSVNNGLSALSDTITSKLDGDVQGAARQQAIDAAAGFSTDTPSAAATVGNDGASTEGLGDNAAGARTVAVPIPKGFNEPDATGGTTEGGFLATRGMQAHADSVPTLEFLQKKQAEIEASLTNDEQKQLFRQHSAGLVEAARRRIEEHTSQQFHVAQEASLEALKGSALTSVASNYTDEEAAKAQVSSVAAGIRELAVSPEDARYKTLQFLGKVDETRLDQYIANKDWQGAQKLFDVAEKTLGPKRNDYATAIANLKRGAEGETEAMRIVREAVDPATGWVSEAKALEKVDELPPGPVKDEASQRVQHRLQQAEAMKKQEINSVFSSALSAYQKAGTLTAVSAADKTYLQDPKRDPTQWERLRSIARADAEHARGAPISGDQQTAMTAFRVWVADNPDQAATMTLEEFQRQWLPTFAKRDREAAGAIFAGAHAKENGTQKDNELVNKVLLQTGREAGVFPSQQNDVSKWDEDAAKVHYRASAALADRVSAYRRANGKPPAAEEVQKWAAQLFLQGTVPGSGLLGGGYFEDKTTRIEAELEGKPFAPKWTDAQKAEATKALTDAGAKVDDATVDLYLRRKNQVPAPPVRRVEPPPPAPNRAMKPTDFR